MRLCGLDGRDQDVKKLFFLVTANSQSETKKKLSSGWLYVLAIRETLYK